MPYIQLHPVRQALHDLLNRDKPQHALTASIITCVDTYAYQPKLVIISSLISALE
jgi:hypothetical protein